jgi:hypothetical protein
VGSGMGSNPIGLALSSVAFLLLAALAYAKNRSLATAKEPDHCSVQEDSYVNRAKTYLRVCIASISEVIFALGTSHLAVVGPLAKMHSEAANASGARRPFGSLAPR